MRKFIIRRTIAMLLSAIAATIVVFGISRAAGDPLLLYAKPGGYGVSPEQIETLEKKLGLDRPLTVQYVMWLSRVMRGDLGRTLLTETPVSKVVGQKIAATFQLGFAAWVLATVVGIPLGVISAVNRGSPLDYVARIFALLGQAVPSFWLGIMSILLFAVLLGWLPVGTKGLEEGFPLSWTNLKYFVLPSITLGWGAAAGYLRITRSAMLEVLDSEYIRLARAKGVSHRRAIWKHAFKNALLPPLTVSSLLLAGFITGSVVTEQVFAWPGLGRLAVRAVQDNDFPIMTACALIFVGIFVILNFVTDILYAIVDPRIRY
jgi:peptide/nickel transport system permease protein